MLTAVAALATAPASAQAGTPGPTVGLGKSKGISYFKGTYDDVVTQTFQPVDCPSGADVSGGGGTIAGPGTTSLLNESYPVPGEGWTVEATSTSGARKLTGYAICDTRRSLDVESFDYALSPSAYTYAGVTCTTREALGGGVSASSSGLNFFTSVPAGASWEIGARNFTLNEIELTVHAVCGKPKGVKIRKSDAVKMNAGETAKATARCKPDEAVMGGGLETTDEGFDYPGATKSLRPFDSKDDKRVPDDGWQVVAANDQSDQAQVVAVAVCSSP